jgi:hypothetical protein
MLIYSIRNLITTIFLFLEQSFLWDVIKTMDISMTNDLFRCLKT